MPLTYQGPISQKPARSLISALDRGQSLLEPVEHARLDVRMTFGDFETLTNIEAWFGKPVDTWMDIAVYPTESFFERAAELVVSAEPFRISCVGRVGQATIEISLESEQTLIRRFDDRLCYEHNDHTTCVLRIQLVSAPNDLDKRDPKLWAIIQRFHAHLSAAFIGLPVPEDMETDVDPIDQQARDWVSVAHAPSEELSEVHCQLNRSQKHPLSLQIRCPSNRQLTLASAWAGAVNQLTRIDVCQLRVIENTASLKGYLDALDLHHDHRWSAAHRFGFTFINRQDHETIAEHMRSGWSDQLLKTAVEWDLRWRGYWGAASADFEAADCSPSRYVIRSSKGNTQDLLFIELPMNDPDGQPFRNARQELSGIFHKKVGEKKAWQFEGPILASALGKANHHLNARLDAVVSELSPTPAADIPPPPKAPGIIAGMTRFLRRKGFEDLSFTDMLTEAIASQLPGFRFDENAHVSDDYFLEFYRKQASGYDLVQVQRLRNPSRFKFVLGVSEFKVYLDELQPTRYRAAPGISVEFERLLPDTWSDEYVMYSQRDRQSVIEIAAAHLLHYGEPFFETTRPILASHLESMKRRA